MNTLSNTATVLAAALLLTGCATQRTTVESRSQAVPTGTQNIVLNHMRAGAKAFEANDRSTAAQHFDEALLRITSIYADDEKARQARSLWYSEGTKDFLGEPYERAMVFYYRGLLDLQNGDYENARASFKSGLLQDAFAEEKQDRADFALMLFLEGWASHLNGDHSLATEAWEELKKFRPDFQAPPANHTALVIAESGKSPRKLADGIGHNMLVYRRGKRFDEKRVRIAGGEQMLYPMEDIYYQASTRGARPIDSILDGQVRFKKNTANLGSVLTDAANTAANVNSYLTGTSSSTGVFGAMQLAGTLALAFSSGARAEADTRYWDNLPDAVHVLTLPASEVGEELVVEYLDDQGTSLDTPLTKSTSIHRDHSGNVLAWVRSRPASQTR